MDAAHDITLRLAEPADSPLLAEAALVAGGGLYEHLLADAAPGALARTAIAAAIAAAGDGGLSWRNAILAEDMAGQALGAAIAYPAALFGLAPAIQAAATKQALADLAPFFAATPPAGSYYLHAIWTAPTARRRGVGALLLAGVEALGAETGATRRSLHLWADNAPARALYRKSGFTEIARIAVVRRPLMPHDGGKLLMATE